MEGPALSISLHSEETAASELLVCKLAHTTRDTITRFWTCAQDAEQWLLVKTFPSKANVFRRKNMARFITVTFKSVRPDLIFNLIKRTQTSEQVIIHSSKPKECLSQRVSPKVHYGF